MRGRTQARGRGARPTEIGHPRVHTLHKSGRGKFVESGPRHHVLRSQGFNLSLHLLLCLCVEEHLCSATGARPAVSNMAEKGSGRYSLICTGMALTSSKILNAFLERPPDYGLQYCSQYPTVQDVRSKHNVMGNICRRTALSHGFAAPKGHILHPSR